MRTRRVLLRLARLAAVLIVVSTLCFLSLNLLPGDPARAILGESGTPQSVAALRQELGLDRPLADRYVNWLGDILRGDFGRSYANRQPVADIILARAPVTVELIVLSQIIALAAAVPLAAVAAIKRGTVVDRGISSLVFVAVSVPSFVLAFVLIWVFAIKLGLYPANGFVPISAGLGQNLGSLFLPALALAAGPAALYQRVLRADLVETYGQEFMNVARAKGISPLRMAVRHAFRPSLLGLTTSIGVVAGVLIGSSVIIENLFSLPGLGSILAQSVSARDYVTVQGVVLVAATSFVLINAVVDLLYGFIDPRLRKTRTAGRQAGRAREVPVA
ncbi:ABC transporter permease [Streptosporangium sp. NPDC000563]|uniref:ABC transporter permease n=1 Tax=unclassified Streptosporangium TaxID=2632669 RepID=UPI00332FE125